MPRVCTVCAHPDRRQIDENIVAGASLRSIAKRFDLGYSSVSRHSTHVLAAVTQAHGVAAVTQADDLLADLRDLKTDLRSARKEAHEAGKYNSMALLANSEMRAYELLAKIFAELNARSSTDVLALPQWQAMRERVVAAFYDDPDGLAKLLAAIGEGEASHAA